MSFGSRFSRKRLPCCVLGFLQEKLNFRIYKTILIFFITIRIPFLNTDIAHRFGGLTNNKSHLYLVHIRGQIGK